MHQALPLPPLMDPFIAAEVARGVYLAPQLLSVPAPFLLTFQKAAFERVEQTGLAFPVASFGQRVQTYAAAHEGEADPELPNDGTSTRF